MHELSITQNIIDIVLDQAKESGAKKVNQVNLEIGELTQVVGDCVAFYFEQITKDTVAEGAKLNIKNIPTKAKCGKCSHTFNPDGLDLTCPECDFIYSEIFEGRELAVTSIDID